MHAHVVMMRVLLIAAGDVLLIIASFTFFQLYLVYSAATVTLNFKASNDHDPASNCCDCFFPEFKGYTGHKSYNDST